MADIVEEAVIYRSTLSAYKRQRYASGLIERLAAEVERLRKALNPTPETHATPGEGTSQVEGTCPTS